jgi:murein DD-endopeptidase MepM/ murein hydrolase activator NlpD
MPAGTPIMAARDGIVIKIKENSNRGGSSKSYEKDGNKVSILHKDGSYAEYVHLQQNGALVNEGDAVKAGQQIGLSGNTGRTTGPHLHFQVAVPTPEGKTKSLPVRFYNHLGEAEPAGVGVGLYAFHPGQPPFETRFGAAISNANYADYKQTISPSNTISDRAETIDGTTVIFIRNGFPVAKRIEISMPQLSNLTPSRELPLTLVLQPLTEIFALFVRESEAGSSYRYRIKWTYWDVE